MTLDELTLTVFNNGQPSGISPFSLGESISISKQGKLQNPSQQGLAKVSYTPHKAIFSDDLGALPLGIITISPFENIQIYKQANTFNHIGPLQMNGVVAKTSLNLPTQPNQNWKTSVLPSNLAFTKHMGDFGTNLLAPFYLHLGGSTYVHFNFQEQAVSEEQAASFMQELEQRVPGYHYGSAMQKALEHTNSWAHAIGLTSTAHDTVVMQAPSAQEIEQGVYGPLQEVLDYTSLNHSMSVQSTADPTILLYLQHGNQGEHFEFFGKSNFSKGEAVINPQLESKPTSLVRIRQVQKSPGTLYIAKNEGPHCIIDDPFENSPKTYGPGSSWFIASPQGNLVFSNPNVQEKAIATYNFPDAKEPTGLDTIMLRLPLIGYK